MRTLIAVGLAALGFVTPASAIVIYGGGSGANTVAPVTGGDPGWNNVGSVNGVTGVYIGNYGGGYWAMTASHVSGGDLTLMGTTYTYVPGSSAVILNSDNSQTDLTVFRVASDPGLGNLTLASVAPVVNLSSPNVRMIGNGLQETGSTLFWNVVKDPSGAGTADTWNSLGSSAGANMAGYSLGSAGKRWGDAFITINAATYTVNGRTQTGIVTEFDAQNGSSQAASGDSGGALFYKNGASWELVGILSAVSILPSLATAPAFDNQPSGTVVDSNLTLAVSIPFYRGAVLAAIPEPAAVGAWIAAMVGFAGIWRRRARK